MGLAASRLGARRLSLAATLLAFLLAGVVRSAPAIRPGTDDGPCLTALRTHGLTGPDDREPARLEIEGAIDGAPDLGFDRNRAVVSVAQARPARGRPLDDAPSWRPTPGLRVRVSMQTQLRPLPGDRVRGAVRLDDVEVGLPGGAATRERLSRAGIACIGSVEGERMAAVGEAGGIRSAVERTRRRLSAAIEATAGAGPTSAVLSSLAIGDRSRISPEQAERFAASGLAHLLSVSGLHLGLTVLGLYRIVSALLRRTPLASRRDPEVVAAILCLPSIPAYALLTGARPPVLRAAVAAGLYLLARIAGRAPEGWTALSAAALALLAWDPANLLDPSFQLSFAACAGLLALTRGLRDLVPLAKPRPESPRWRRWLESPLGAIATTAAATLATLPLTALHFQRASLAAIPANLVAVPVGLAATALCATAVGVGLVAEGAMAPILRVAGPIAGLLDGLAAHFAAWPGAAIPLATPSPSAVAAMWLGALCLAGLRRAPRRSIAGLAACLLVLWSPWTGLHDGRLVVELLAVGQGDATLLTFPDGSRMLVDAGGDLRGERDVARRVLLPQLAARRVSRLEVLALSHLHPDHVGSVPTLLDALPVGELWTSGRALEGRLGAPIAERIAALGIPRRILSRGSAPLALGGVRVEVLGPPDRDGLRDEPLFGDNDGSLVLRVVHGDVAILLPGDVEEEGEAALVASGAALSAALIKAPHHGSSTSSTPAFLERVAPQHVVFCVGRRNPFGFPRPEVVERYEKIGCRLHRTDRGPVRFASDGRRLVLLEE